MAGFGFLRRGRHERAGFALYGAAVRAARAPVWFTDYAVSDTLDGRFDLVGLFVVIMIQRLRALPPPDAALAQAVFDAMFADMDFCLREMGVGDMGVPKRVRDMWEALHGRALAYEVPLASGDETALAAALARNVWRGADPPGAAARLAAIAVRQRQHLDTLTPADFRHGTAVFMDEAEALA